MYIPPHFKLVDQVDALKFMRAYPFGILVSAANNRPLATHIPFIFAEARGTHKALRIQSHLAAANAQVEALTDGPLLCIFSEPHAYISPSLYNRIENVPTWNYVAVHAYGLARVMTGRSEKIALLEAMIEVFEPAYKTHWAAMLASGSRYVEENLHELCAFEIEVTELQAAAKLSQNKSAEERERIASHLSACKDDASRDLAAYMNRISGK